MSPVFRHGSLRLYLLRLLDEEPRHGYEVILLRRGERGTVPHDAPLDDGPLDDKGPDNENEMEGETS